MHLKKVILMAVQNIKIHFKKKRIQKDNLLI